LTGIETVGFEFNSDRISYDTQMQFNNHLYKYKFKDCSTLVSKFRSIKSNLEISYAEKAAKFVTDGLNIGIEAIRPGMMETELAGVVSNEMMSQGCEYTAYPCFIAAEDADCVYENIKNPDEDGKAVSRGRIDSIMAGLNCGGVSEIAWPLLRDYISTYITIGDEWARIAVRELYHHSQRVYSGESGAAGYAGLMVALKTPEIREHLELNNSSNVLVVNTEGVTDTAIFDKIIGRTKPR
jgi:hypothetical protein